MPSPHKRNSRDYDDEDDYYDREMRDRGSSSCCSCTKFIVFLVFLGASVGAIFGFVELDQIENFFTGGSSGGGDSGGDDGGGGASDPVFQFMQCPETGNCCNGLESNCNLDVNEVFFAAVHNANHDDILIPNNEAPLEGALEAGYRGLLLDVCKCPNAETNTMEITFCHGVCGVGPRDLTEVFTNINTFLTDNPSELIIVNFEMSVGDATPEEVWEIMKTDNGVRQKTYNHAGGDWPTMGELLADGKQLILFEHNHNENCSDPTNPGCSPRIETFFNHAVETTWVFSNVEEINDYDRSCAEDRGSGGLKYFYSINHFGKEEMFVPNCECLQKHLSNLCISSLVTATFGPSKSSADVLNEIDSINNRVTACEKITKNKVSIFSVDFWQRGHLPEVAQTINKSRGKRRRNKRSRFLQWMLE